MEKTGERGRDRQMEGAEWALAIVRELTSGENMQVFHLTSDASGGFK